eukprot:941625-Prymnesium_polylepis.1
MALVKRAVRTVSCRDWAADARPLMLLLDFFWSPPERLLAGEAESAKELRTDGEAASAVDENRGGEFAPSASR